MMKKQIEKCQKKLGERLERRAKSGLPIFYHEDETHTNSDEESQELFPKKSKECEFIETRNEL